MIAGWGMFLWLIVALAIRIAPPVLFERGAWTALLFASALPNAWITIRLTRRLFSLAPWQIVPAAACASAAAMLLDGVALTWTTLYGPENKDLVPAAAMLLWGVAWILVFAFVESRRGVARMAADRPGNGEVQAHAG
ncbi:MAG TPA: hypothetical protein VK325_00830 [Pseudoxanthomonas sp.]|nr:hypothetical protein [Pseudoxanthomonas sp.]